jgi:succinate dehydrogenase / fumarate reductase, membrane anchor subunit
MSYQTRLKHVKFLGSARRGTDHWVSERLTSLLAIPLTLLLIVFVITHLGSPRPEIVASLKNPIYAIGLPLALLITVWHMYLGMRVIIEDYVHGEAAKFAALLFNYAYCGVIGAIGLFALIKMGFAL